MLTLKRTLLIAVTAPTLTTLTTACLTQGGAARGPGGSDNAILASVGGISDEDVKTGELTFFLSCDTSVRVQGESKTSADGKSYVRFPGDQVKDGNICSMEIESKKWAADKSFKWYGMKDGKPVEGLAYASNAEKVASRKLALKLYKLYARATADAFTLTVNVQFEAEAAMPATAAATLVCGADESYGGKFEPIAGGKNAALVFQLSAEKFKDKTCAQVVALAEAQKYAAETADLSIKDAKKGDKPTFPKEADKRYTMKLIPVSGTDPVDVDAELTDCVKVDTVAKKCLDVPSVKTPAKSILLAKVQGRLENGKGEVVTYYAAAGEKGLGVFAGEALTTEALNKAIAANASDADKKSFHFYNDALDKDLLKKELDAKLAAGEGLESVAIDRAELASVKLLHIETVHLHGFHMVEAKDLDKLESATWIAMVEHVKADKKTSFVVTGYDKYLRSNAAPKVEGKPKYVDIAELRKDMAAAGTTDRWRVYALEGTPMAATACKATAQTFVQDLSLRTRDDLSADKPEDLVKSLDACEVSKDNFKLETEGTLTEKAYLFGWHEAAR